MSDDIPTDAINPPIRRRRAAARPAGPPASPAAGTVAAPVADESTPAASGEAAPAPKRRRRTTKSVAASTGEAPAGGAEGADPVPVPTAAEAGPAAAEPAPAARRRRRGAVREQAAAEPSTDEPASDEPAAADQVPTPASVNPPPDAAEVTTPTQPVEGEPEPEPVRPPRRRRSAPVVTFQAPDPSAALAAAAVGAEETGSVVAADALDRDAAESDEASGDDDDADGGDGRPRRRRRGRRGRGRGRGSDEAGERLDGSGDPTAGAGEGGAGEDTDTQGDSGAFAGVDEAAEEDAGEAAEDGPSSRRRRRRRRRSGSGGEDGAAVDDPPNTVVKVREVRSRDEGVRGLSGSTRLEAKRQRRRDGRDTSRHRAPVVTEAEFLARRESVERVMVVRARGERTQVAVLEDGVLSEHFVTRTSAASYAGNVYLGRVQNVLPSMEAAFIDIGKGRNAVLYAGEVNYDASGLEGRPRTIEQALKSGQAVLVQVTKDPIGSKGSRLTSQISLPGRYLVYVPNGSTTGISRKLPDVERSRLKAILKKVLPEDAGVIIRTAAEGASEEEISRDVARLEQQWQEIQRRAAKATPPALLSEEPDLVIRVVRDVFNEDFSSMVVQGDAEWETLLSYVSSVAPELVPRLSKWTSEQDVFRAHRIDEQLAKALDRKVHLPSGGSLVIDRTEAMTVVDVNTGRFTGKGGNLEETVTRNNLEAAEEIVRQLRLRDIGGMIVVDFIDMVLESNRELVLRRLTECLGRDRTKHQVAEVTSLGLVQMTRKRVGGGLLEAFSEPCEHCRGRGVLVHLDDPAPEPRAALPLPLPRPTPPLPRPLGAPATAAAEDADQPPAAAPEQPTDAPPEVASESDAGRTEFGLPAAGDSARRGATAGGATAGGAAVEPPPVEPPPVGTEGALTRGGRVRKPRTRPGAVTPALAEAPVAGEGAEPAGGQPGSDASVGNTPAAAADAAAARAPRRRRRTPAGVAAAPEPEPGAVLDPAGG